MLHSCGFQDRYTNLDSKRNTRVYLFWSSIFSWGNHGSERRRTLLKIKQLIKFEYSDSFFLSMNLFFQWFSPSKQLNCFFSEIYYLRNPNMKTEIMEFFTLKEVLGLWNWIIFPNAWDMEEILVWNPLGKSLLAFIQALVQIKNAN